MTATTNTMAAWDAIAASFDATRQRPWPLVLDFIKNHPGTTLFDLGCGNGRHLLPAADYCTQGVGVDFSRELLKITNQKIQGQAKQNLSCIQATLTNLPFCDASADIVLFIAAVHNIRGRQQRVLALQEVSRVLKPGGWALISVWSRWQDKYRRHFLKDLLRPQGEFGDIDVAWQAQGLNVPRFYHLYSRREFRQDLTAAGLRVCSLEATRFVSRYAPDNFFAFVQKA